MRVSEMYVERRTKEEKNREKGDVAGVQEMNKKTMKERKNRIRGMGRKKSNE